MITTPNCPLCNEPPAMAWAELTPWFCRNDDCDVLAWDPYATLEENLMDARPAILTETPLPEE